MVSNTPNVMKEIGFEDLPMTIKQKYLQYAIQEKEYARKQKYIDDHKYDEEDFKRLPEKLAKPVAVIWDGNDDTVRIYINMKAKSGNNVIVPMIINQEKNLNGKPSRINHLKSVYGRIDAINELDAAIKHDSDSDIRLFYLDRDQYKQIKMTSLGETGAGTHESWNNLPNGVIHRITDPGSHVKLQNSIMYDIEDQEFSAGDDERTDAQHMQILVDAGILSREDADAYLNGIQDNSGPMNATPVNDSETEGPKGQRQFGTVTAQESNALHQLVKDHLYKNSEYTKDTNQAQINRAIDWVLSLGTESDPDGYHAAVEAVTSPDFDYLSADGQARMLVTMAMAATNNNPIIEMRIADAYNRQGTDLGRMLQSRKIFRLMTPIGRRMALESEAAKINQEYKNQGKDVEVHLSNWVLDAAAAAKTEEDFQKVQDAAEAEIAAQMPSTWQDKLRTWRMMSMLANPRTHIRNLVGNWLFVPTVGIKNRIAEQIENMASEKGLYGYQMSEKTKAHKYSPEAIEFAAEDVNVMKDTLTGEAKYGPESRIKQQQKAFGQGEGILSKTLGKTVQGISDANSWALEAEDWLFLNRHYQNALASYMTSNNLTKEQMTGTTLDKARAYAVEEAQKATYRDANAISSWLNEMSNKGGIGGFLVDSVLPFKKTPANILRRGIEYSPVGLISSLATAKKSLSLYAAWEANGKKGEMPKGAKSVNQVIDGIASGLTGTGIAALGAFLYSTGALKLKFKDDDDELEKERGGQEYSVELFGYSFTLDWAAPVCMPFFTGAALCETVMNQKGEDFNFNTLVDAIFQMSDPVFNLSMLDGVGSTLKTIQSSSGASPIGQILQKIGSNYLGSFAPSFLGAVARTVDPVRRKAYGKSGATTWDYLLEQVENKIPFLSRSNIPVRDVWGDVEESSVLEAFLENFLLPGYVSKLKTNTRTEEIQRLYDKTHDSSVIPKSADKTISVGGKNVKLDDKQYDQYAETRGQTAKALLEELFSRPEYLALSETNPDAQVVLVKDVWSYANYVGKKEQFDEANPSAKWMETARTNGNVIDTIFEMEETKAKKADTSAHKDDLFKSIEEENADGIATHIEGMKRGGRTNSSIKSTLTSRYKPLYQQAVIDNDQDTMRAIRYGLLYADLGDDSYLPDTIDKWAYDARNKQSGTTENQDTTGQYGLGNIDLNNRKTVMNEDGSISTEISMSFYDEDSGKEVLIPTVVDGKIVTEDEAIDHYYETGEYLGMFDTPEEADSYANLLHNRQDWYYHR